MSGFHASLSSMLLCGLLFYAGSGQAQTELSDDEIAVKKESRRGPMRTHSCARLAELDESAVLALSSYVASGEEWYCRPERTAQCRDYEPVVRPHAWLEPAPGGYLCRLMISD